MADEDTEVKFRCIVGSINRTLYGGTIKDNLTSVGVKNVGVNPGNLTRTNRMCKPFDIEMSHTAFKKKGKRFEIIIKIKKKSEKKSEKKKSKKSKKTEHKIKNAEKETLEELKSRLQHQYEAIRTTQSKIRAMQLNHNHKSKNHNHKSNNRKQSIRTRSNSIANGKLNENGNDDYYKQLLQDRDDWRSKNPIRRRIKPTRIVIPYNPDTETSTQKRERSIIKPLNSFEPK
eukprot:838553_1